MIRKQVFVLAALGVAAGTALAQQAPGTPLTRAEVVQSVLQARAAGMQLPVGEGSQEIAQPAAASTLTRAQVHAQVLQARAEGSLHVGEAVTLDWQAAPARLSRAEVLADLQVYGESGLAKLASGEAPDTGSVAYQRAQANYAQLRHAPSFATRVQRIEARRGEGLTLAKG